MRFRLLTSSEGQPSSGLLAIRLASDGASEQMDMRATAASCRSLSLLGRAPLFFTSPSSSSSIKLGFRVSRGLSEARPDSSVDGSGELSLERVPKPEESFLSRSFSGRRPGLVNSPAGCETRCEDGRLALASLWRSGVVLSASSGPESSSLDSFW